MPGLRDFRSRIKSVKNTKKITYAMKLVSATKLKRAQDTAISSRAYSNSIANILRRALALSADLNHPLNENRNKVNKICLLIVSSNRGLCGAYNSNINKAARRFSKELKEGFPGAEVDALILGKKAAEFFTSKDMPFSKSIENLSEDPKTWPINDICEDLELGFTSGKYDRVYIVYTKARSAMSMSVKCEQLLPFVLSDALQADANTGSTSTTVATTETLEPIFKPSLEEIFKVLVPRVMRSNVVQACFEAKASEHASRMTAMDAATKNAGELVSKLTLKLNKMRQSSITSEILDIVGGAEALK